MQKFSFTWCFHCTSTFQENILVPLVPLVSIKVDLGIVLAVPTKKPCIQRGAETNKSGCTEGKREGWRWSSSSLASNFTVTLLEFANNNAIWIWCDIGKLLRSESFLLFPIEWMPSCYVQDLQDIFNLYFLDRWSLHNVPYQTIVFHKFSSYFFP